MDEENQEQRGTIVDVIGQGGMLALVLRDSSGKLSRVYGDSGPTGRALIAAFGPGVRAGVMTLDAEKLKGLEIAYAVDDLGLLTYIRNPDED